MEVKIRDLDPMLVKKIDELAHKKGISRNQCLKNILKRFCVQSEITDYEQSAAKTMIALRDLVEKNIDVLNRVEQFIGDGSEGF